MSRLRFVAVTIVLGTASGLTTLGGDPQGHTRLYENRLKPIMNPQPILSEFPEFVEPIRETARFEAPMLVNDDESDLDVRAWRFSYNARGIIEIPNRLDAKKTAIVVVHPWGIDDGSGWRTPEPAGVAFQCTPDKNAIVLKHATTVINPFLKRMRGRVGLVAYSLPGREDPIRKRLYRSVRSTPDALARLEGQKLLNQKLNAFRYDGAAIPGSITVSTSAPTVEYFRSFPGLDAGDRYDPKGFWDLPTPVMRPIEVAPSDLVIYDAEGYELFRDYLKAQGIRHILLAGYNTDMCVCSTTAGYRNLSKDFDVFLVGDATIATFPAQPSPRFATTAAVSFASLNLLISQVSWIKPGHENEGRQDGK